MPLPSLYIYEMLVFLHQNGSLFGKFSVKHSNNTRNVILLNYPSHKLKLFEKSPLYMGIRLYIKIPANCSCSHIRSYRLFMESITSDRFVAKACNSWFDFTKGKCGSGIAVMGEQVDLRARGSYYLYTAGTPPYAVGNATRQQQNRRLKQ